MAQTFTSNYGQLAKDKGADITKVDGFNQAMDLLLSNRVDGTFNDSLSYLDYKTKPNAKIKAIKGNAEQSKSAFTFNKDVDDKVVSDFNDGLKTLKENGKLAKLVRNGSVKMFLSLNSQQQHALDAGASIWTNVGRFIKIFYSNNNSYIYLRFDYCFIYSVNAYFNE